MKDILEFTIFLLYIFKIFINLLKSHQNHINKYKQIIILIWDQ